MINRILIGLAIGGGAAVGAAGIAIGYSGAVSFSRGVEASVTTGALAYYACPNLGAVGQFHSGDRVYVTGIDESGEWLQVRAPHDLDDRAWVQREYVDPDEDFEAPLATCNAEVGELALAEGPTPTTTTTEPGDEEPDEVDEPEPTTTTAPATTTTTTAAPTTTTAPPATTTTTAPDHHHHHDRPDHDDDDRSGAGDRCHQPQSGDAQVDATPPAPARAIRGMRPHR
jgi:hypothetical protein